MTASIRSAWRFAVLGALTALAAGCASSPEPRIPISSNDDAAFFQRCRGQANGLYASSAGFESWIGEVRAVARRCGVREATLSAALGNVRRADIGDPDAQLAAEREQWAARTPGPSRGGAVNPLREYAERRTAELEDRGRDMMRRHATALRAVERRYGVHAEYIVAFWGVETNYGGFTGNHDVVETLANLGWGSKRRRFFTDELLAALIMLDRGYVSRGQFKGSYAGATGQAQFMPSSFLLHAVDGDGDGRRDIWNSPSDIFASIANYSVQRGRWDSRVSQAMFEVELPRNFAFERADIQNKDTVGSWGGMGVRPVATTWPPRDATAAIFLPAGCEGPAVMVTQNWFAIMEYNPSETYAFTVALLAERIKGEFRLRRPWPDYGELSTRERSEVQARLSSLGYGSLATDGQIGRQSREAIRAFQRRAGLCADGYASTRVLERLRGGSRGRFASAE